MGQRPNKHETGGLRVNGIRLFSQSGYHFALLASIIPEFKIILEYPPFSLFRMMGAAGVTEELKARDPMRWVGLMNTLKVQVEETIFQELIFQ